jgi:hypothetical protein
MWTANVDVRATGMRMRPGAETGRESPRIPVAAARPAWENYDWQFHVFRGGLVP